MKKFYLLLIVFIAVLLYSCGDKKTLVIPEDILTKEQMVQVMTNIYIIDGATDQHNFASGITMPADPKVSYERFVNNDSLSYDAFRKSYDFYLQHPAELNQIYEQVLNEISRLQAVHSK